MSFETASHPYQFKAIIFDLDGTLLDTLNDIAEAMNLVLRDNGFPPHPIDMYKNFIGKGLEKLIEQALPLKAVTPLPMPTYLQAFRAAYAKNWHTNTRPYPGIPDLLTHLSQQDVSMAILSNKAHEFTVQMATALLDRWQFQQIRGAGSEFPKKPNPKAAWHIINHMNLRREQCLLVGDSGIDMQTATAAGIFPVGVTWGFRPESELLDNGCRFLARHPLDILKLFKFEFSPA